MNGSRKRVPVWHFVRVATVGLESLTVCVLPFPPATARPRTRHDPALSTADLRDSGARITVCVEAVSSAFG